MASILEALEMAQQRNKERDEFNAQRGMPVLPLIPTGPLPSPMQNLYDSGDGAPKGPVKTPHEQYLDAVSANQWVNAVPVVGPVLGYMNDAYIENYEKENPNMVVGGGINKYSTLGRIAGKGLTVEEQLEAEKAGLGIGKAFGFGDRKPNGQAQPGYTLYDRVFGTTPLNWATESDFVGVSPDMTSIGWESGGGGDGPAAAQGTSNFGGRESSVNDNDRSGYA